MQNIIAPGKMINLSEKNIRRELQPGFLKRLSIKRFYQMQGLDLLNAGKII